MPRLRPEEILRTLLRHEVDFLLIGGVAATLYGSNLRTGDVAICPHREAGNLSRLAAALREMEARVRAEGVRAECPLRPTRSSWSASRC